VKSHRLENGSLKGFFLQLTWGLISGTKNLGLAGGSAGSQKGQEECVGQAGRDDGRIRGFNAGGKQTLLLGAAKYALGEG